MGGWEGTIHSMSKALNVLLVVGLLVIAGITGYGLISAAREATRPIANPGGTIATSVAAILPPTPTPLPNGEAVVLSIKALARLETAQFTIEKVIIKEQGQGALGALFGDRVIFVAHGDVIAGVDLGKMIASDVVVLPDGKAFVTLPAPEIFVTNIDNDKSYVVDRQTGLLTKGDVNLETDARREAQAEIEAAAREAGIIQQAQTNSEIYVRQLLAMLGYTDVTFVFATPTP